MSLPEQWRRVPLGQITDTCQYGASIAGVEQNNGPRLIRITDITEDGQLLTEDAKYAAQNTQVISDYLLREGDILIARSGSVGRSLLYRETQEPAVFASYLIRVRPQAQIVNLNYFDLLLKSLIFRRYVNAVSTGAVVANINSTQLLRFQVPVAPTLEQERIISILKQAETVRNLRNSAYEKAKKIISTLYQETFLSHPERETWPVVTIGEAGDVQAGRQRSPQYQTGRYSKPYLRVANVLEDKLDLSEQTGVLEMDFDSSDFAKYRLKYGDILLNEGQSTELVGRPAMWRDELPEVCYQNHLIRFRADDKRIIPEYAIAMFLHLFRTGVFARLSTKTSNLATLGTKRVAAIDFRLPPLELQRDFVKKVDAVRGVVQSIEEKTKKMEDTFRGLTASAFAGKLTEAWRKKPDVAPILNQQAAERDALLDGAATEPAETPEIAAVKITDLSIPSHRKDVAAEIVNLFDSGSGFAFQLEAENEITPVQWRDVVRRVLASFDEDTVTERLLYLQDAIWDIAQPETEAVGDELSTLENIGDFSPDSPTHPRATFWQEVGENSPLRKVYNAFRVSPGEGYNNLQTILAILDDLGEPLEEYKVQQALTTLESAGLIYEVVLEVATSRGVNAEAVRLEAYRLPLEARTSKVETGVDQS